jgi:ADP-heptose:LPS heptosyltransferase
MAGVTVPKTAPAQLRPIQLSPRKQFLANCLGGAAALARGWNRSTVRLGPPPARILVLEPFGLGDIISFEPLVRCLREAAFDVVVCSKPEWRALYPPAGGLRWLDLQVPWATHNERAKYRFASYLQNPWRDSFRRLREYGRGAVGIDTRGDIRSGLLLQLAGCRRVLSLSTYLGSNVTVSRRAAELVPFEPSLRRWELNVAFLEPLGVKRDRASITPPYFRHLATSRPGGGRSVGLMPIAPWRGKLWAGDRWRALITYLRAMKCDVQALCGPGQTAAARQEVGEEVAMTECGSVESWAQELGRCDLIVTLDSGPMHLADALGVPVIALFGQGWLPFWAPSGPHSRVIAHQEDPDFTVCHPIEENTPLGQNYMNRITVEEVLAQVEETFRALDAQGQAG